MSMAELSDRSETETDTMSKVQSTLRSKAIEFAGDAFSGFCEDIGGMFGVDMSCEELQVHENVGAEIKKSYKKLAVVYTVKSTGALEGEFQILFDKAGLFTMAGVLVMLPSSRILNNAKRGTPADASDMSDAVGEVGNLLIGSWDRTFRNGLKDNTHFLHAGTFMGDLCAEDSDVLDMAGGKKAVFVSYEMSVGEYPAFRCGVHFPHGLLEEVDSDSEPEVPNMAEPEVSNMFEPEPEEEPTPVVEAAKKVSVQAAEAVKKVAVPAAEAVKKVPAIEIEAPKEIPAPVAEAPQAEVVAAPMSEPPDTIVLSACFNTRASLASQIMQTQVYWATADDTVREAQGMMQQKGVSHLLIGDGTKLEGIVTQSDLASAASIYLRPIFAKWRRPEDDATLQIRLKWIMSRQIYSVKPETPFFNIVHLICKYNISCLPVVDVQGQVLGLVTAEDMFKAMLNNELLTTGASVM
jgi:acetoin utilization protein AcuB